MLTMPVGYYVERLDRYKQTSSLNGLCGVRFPRNADEYQRENFTNGDVWTRHGGHKITFARHVFT